MKYNYLPITANTPLEDGDLIVDGTSHIYRVTTQLVIRQLSGKGKAKALNHAELIGNFRLLQPAASPAPESPPADPPEANPPAVARPKRARRCRKNDPV